MRRALLSAMTALVSFAACGAPPATPGARPNPSPVNVVIAPVPDAGIDPMTAETLRLAERAVTKLAERLQQVDDACRTRWLSAPDVCTKSELEGLARAYRAYYPPDTDPRRNEGRIDALPRIAGPDTSLEQLDARVELACEARCDTARRISIEDIRSAAVEACLVKGRAACAALRKMIPPKPLPSVRDVVQTCEETCKEKKRTDAVEAEYQRRRPKTLAESRVCFRKCMSGCTGGRIVPNLDGSYTKPPDDWCGTCDFSCEVSCAIP